MEIYCLIPILLIFAVMFASVIVAAVEAMKAAKHNKEQHNEQDI